MFVSAGAGVFDPWEGSIGREVDASFLTTFGGMRHVRVGGEMTYRSAEGEILKVQNVDFDSYRMSFVAHYRPVLDWFLAPYLGARLTGAINDSDGRRIERERPLKDVHHSETFGFGAAAIAGIDIPLGKYVVLYGESSFGADLLLVDAHNSSHTRDDPDDLNLQFFPDLSPRTSSENVGGATGTAGIRIRF
ncbi:hypothetical protein K2X89_12990 [Myxococcota bacterium]|nr:hypothetical protein [Myxococcota bacterium]